MGQRILSFRELQIYRESCELDLAVFLLTKRFPREELYALTDQVRRSSRAVGAAIAEAWAKRRYPAHFVSKLTDADAELQETHHWINRALAYGYLTIERHDEIEANLLRIGRRLGTALAHPEAFSREARSADDG